MELFDEQGNKVEALTPEEVDAKLDEIREQTIEETNKLREDEVDGLTTQLTEKETDLKTAQDDLEKEKNKDKNLAGQRGVIEEKDKVVKGLQETVETLTKTIADNFSALDTKALAKTASDLMLGLAGEDKKLAEKLKFHYDSFNPIDTKDKTPEAVDEEIKQRVSNSYVLATGSKPTNPLTGNVISSAGSGVPAVEAAAGDKKLSADGVAAGKELGVTDEEMKKHNLV